MDKDIRRIRLLKLWEILSTETDKEHPFSTEDIIDKLAEIGIDCHRITLYEDIKLLNKYGYEVLCVRSSSNKYYVADRNISVPEVLILMDAVQAASFVTEIKTGELIDKVAKLAGSQKAEVLKQNIVEFTIAKTTSSDKFQNYYKDISLRMKNREIDLLIVVNMFLTGFDATTLNTLWVDKNLKQHGLIQAFSRTNRILNSIKTFGNVVCFRNLQKRTDAAISLFGDKDAGGICLMKGYKDYYFGYVGAEGKREKGYVDLISELEIKYPLSEPSIIGEQAQKDFIGLFGAIVACNIIRLCLFWKWLCSR